VEIEEKSFPPLFSLAFLEWEVTENEEGGNGISIPTSFDRHVCHGRNNSVSSTGTSNTTPQEMVYRECVCMGDRMGIFIQHYG
jgi:hypothetical protein